MWKNRGMAAEAKRPWTTPVQSVGLSLAGLGVLFAIVYLLWCAAHNDVTGEARAGCMLVGIFFVSCGVGLLAGTQRRSPILIGAALFYFLLGAVNLLALLPLNESFSIIPLGILAVAAVGMMLLPPLLAAFAPGTMRILRPVLWLLALALYGVAFVSLGWTRSPWVPAIFLLFGGVIWLVAIVITAAALKDRFISPTR
jgi:hypothetical protein